MLSEKAKMRANIEDAVITVAYVLSGLASPKPRCNSTAGEGFGVV